MPFTCTGTREWSIPSTSMPEKGRYFLGIGEFAPNVTATMARKPNALEFSHVMRMSVDYDLRVTVSGCYYREPKTDSWINPDIHVSDKRYI